MGGLKNPPILLEISFSDSRLHYKATLTTSTIQNEKSLQVPFQDIDVDCDFLLHIHHSGSDTLQIYTCIHYTTHGVKVY